MECMTKMENMGQKQCWGSAVPLSSIYYKLCFLEHLLCCSHAPHSSGPVPRANLLMNLCAVGLAAPGVCASAHLTLRVVVLTALRVCASTLVTLGAVVLTGPWFCDSAYPITTGHRRHTAAGVLFLHCLARKFWNRFRSRIEILGGPQENSFVVKEDAMPEASYEPFFRCIRGIILKTYQIREGLLTWMVPRSFYALWRRTSYVQVALFADCLNESGVLQHYCSKDTNDNCVGSLSSSGANEEIVSGDYGNPP